MRASLELFNYFLTFTTELFHFELEWAGLGALVEILGREGNKHIITAYFGVYDMNASAFGGHIF